MFMLFPAILVALLAATATATAISGASLLVVFGVYMLSGSLALVSLSAYAALTYME